VVVRAIKVIAWCHQGRTARTFIWLRYRFNPIDCSWTLRSLSCFTVHQQIHSILQSLVAMSMSWLERLDCGSATLSDLQHIARSTSVCSTSSLNSFRPAQHVAWSTSVCSTSSLNPVQRLNILVQFFIRESLPKSDLSFSLVLQEYKYCCYDNGSVSAT